MAVEIGGELRLHRVGRALCENCNFAAKISIMKKKNIRDEEDRISALIKPQLQQKRACLTRFRPTGCILGRFTRWRFPAPGVANAATKEAKWDAVCVKKRGLVVLTKDLVTKRLGISAKSTGGKMGMPCPNPQRHRFYRNLRSVGLWAGVDERAGRDAVMARCPILAQAHFEETAGACERAGRVRLP